MVFSYTDFSYSDLKLSSTRFKDSVSVSVKVTNIGKVAGKEVVQLYLTAPGKTMDKPREELKGFAKTALLKPGANQVLTFVLGEQELASFSTEKSAWLADAGDYIVKVGASSTDIRLTKGFNVKGERKLENVNKVMVPQIMIHELKSKSMNSRGK
ncbi:fibronectin type III-like domain-contianing protein [Sphingobacterium sp. DR205]|uniref:fibronectin type III-like domain-contianing protein n=1 Tax=Sphingobacterium sp. DR205 TaxID=2713573 RepID=UPI001F4A08AA|nr:fibronectin type III-like domain-contianing protein [Sphingobacterium sp. DR205]